MSWHIHNSIWGAYPPLTQSMPSCQVQLLLHTAGVSLPGATETAGKELVLTSKETPTLQRMANAAIQMPAAACEMYPKCFWQQRVLTVKQ